MKLKSFKEFLSITEVNRVIILLVMGLGMYALNPLFLSAANVRTIVLWGAFYSIMILGQMLYLIPGGIDLSLGGVISLTNVLMGVLIIWWGFDIWLAVLLILTLGAAIGLVTALFSNAFSPPFKFLLPVFVFTIMLHFALAGVALVITRALPISGFPAAFALLAKGALGPLPIFTVYLIIMVGVLAYIFYFRPLGWHLFAAGLNDEVAVKAGINVKKVRVIAFMSGSFIQAFVGILMASYMAVGSSVTGPPYLLPVVAGALIGGISLAGGEGSPFGAVVGGFAVYIIENIIVVLEVTPFWTQIVTGLFLVSFVSFDFYQKRRKAHLR